MKIKIKKILIFITVTALFLIIYALLSFSCAKKLASDIINNKTKNFEKNFLNWQVLTFWIPPIREFNQILPDLVGINEPQTYFLLLQNNGELRPSGGFIGSYAKIKLQDGGITNIQVQDIYVPDGQIPGHVTPPWPIQQAFKQGFWRLRDSNWKIDFPTASKDISWFFQKGGEVKPDGFIAINLLPIKDILKITGPIKLPDYNKTITTDNLINTIQKQTEENFFPGSTQKQNILSSFATHLFFQLKDLSPKQSFQLAKKIYKNLRQNQILLYFKSPDAQIYFSKLNWTGELKRSRRRDGLSGRRRGDFIYIVDTNLSSNKANFYVDRKVEQTVNLNNNQLTQTLKINYTNNSQYPRPNIQNNFWGGDYKNFLRIVIPMEAQLKFIKFDGEVVEKTETKKYPNQNLQSIGFFVQVPHQSQIEVQISYQLPYNLKKYYLEILKQPGISSYPHTVIFNAKKIEKDIIRNSKFTFQ